MYTVFQFNEMAVMVLCLTVALALAVGQVDGTADSCYPPLGCFSNNAPWTTLLRPMQPPKSPQFIDTRYDLYTRNAPNRFIVNNPSVGVYNVDGSDFDGNRPTIFIAHGFNGNGLDIVCLPLKDAVLAKYDANVIVVDWAKGASDGTYFNAASNTRVVAATTVAFINYLKNSKGVLLSKVHLIGHSLGAHISGYVGKNFTLTGSTKIGRISALDAAAPFFENFDTAVHLDINDAVYVDAVHTDARTLGLGWMQPIGHSDFYVNGGWGQPNCGADVPAFSSLLSFGNALISSFQSALACPHLRAVEVFASSATCRFWGHKIDAWQRTAILTSGFSLSWPANHCNGATCSDLGFNSNHYPARGSFDVITANSPPYCLFDSATDTAMTQYYIP